MSYFISLFVYQKSFIMFWNFVFFGFCSKNKSYISLKLYILKSKLWLSIIAYKFNIKRQITPSKLVTYSKIVVAILFFFANRFVNFNARLVHKMLFKSTYIILYSNLTSFIHFCKWQLLIILITHELKCSNHVILFFLSVGVPIKTF